MSDGVDFRARPAVSLDKGVKISDGVVTILQSVPDITSDKSSIEHIVDLCCRLQLEPIHLIDIIDDYIEGI